MPEPLVIDGDAGERVLSVLEVDGAPAEFSADVVNRIQQAIERGYEVTVSDLALGALRISWRKR